MTEEIVVVDDGKTYEGAENTATAQEAAAEAKLWAEESERQAGFATASAVTAVNAKDDAVAAKEYAEAAVTDPNLITVATDLNSTPSNIKTVATNISDVNAVGSNISNVNAVADNETNINAVAGNATNINAVNSNKTNINKVANKINNVNAVAEDLTNIDTVAGISSEVGTVAGNASNINTVAGISSDVSTVSSNSSNISTVAASISNVNSVAGDLANINAVARDLTNINNASTHATNARKWAEGTDSEVTPLGGTHSAKVWAEIAEEAAESVGNPANRDLSNLSTAGEYRFDSQNETISNCILEIPQDIKLELNDGVLTLKAGSILRTPNNQTRTITEDRTIQVGNAGNTEYCIFMQKYSNTETPSLHMFNKVCSGATDTLAGVNYHVWFDTTNNIIRRYGTNHNNPTECFLPLCIAKTNSDHTSWESITKVFNGAGYIGHHAFVLPDVKVLTPDGFNDNGCFKSNIKTTLLTVGEMSEGQIFTGINKVITNSSAWAGYKEVENYNDADFSKTWLRYYVRNDNKIYTKNSQGVIIQIKNETPLITHNYNGTNVTKFDICQPYDGVRDLLGDEAVNRALSIKGNTFKIYQPTLSDEVFGAFYLFVFPDGHNILFDTGYENEEDSIDTFLSSLNIKHIDVVMISHFHLDHCGGATHIIDNYCDSNTKFYKCMDCDYTKFTSNQTSMTGYENTYKTALANKGYTYTIPANKSTVSLFNGTVELTFYNTDTSNLSTYYNPEMIEQEAGSTANNVSMCCLVRAYGTSVFLSGDIEYSGQKAIANYVPQNVDILQIPHHAVNINGYAPFFDRLNPKVTFYNKNNETVDNQYKYWFRYMNYTKEIPVINNATTTGIEMEVYKGNVKLLNGRIVQTNGNLDDYNILAVLPSPYDTVHNARDRANWTIADVVDMCQYKVNQNIRLGVAYATTTLINELNTLVASTSWIITPHIEYITIQNRRDISVAPKRAKSVSEHS